MTNSLIVINGYDFSNDKCCGIHRNAMEIAACIDVLLGECGHNVKVEAAVPAGCDAPLYENIRPVVLDCGKKSKLDKLKWREVVYPQYIKKVDAIGLDMTLGLPKRGRFCVFDYDCIVEDHAEVYYYYYASLRRIHYMRRVRNSLKRAQVVFTDSNYAKARIQEHYGCPDEKMVVVPCAWQHMQRFVQDDGVLEKFGLEDKIFFFALGSRYPYKNFRWVECAARQNPQYQFVVTGSEIGSGDKDGTDKPSNLLFTGYLSDGEIKGLMAHCKAFLQPSFEEGFGIPPLEAMSVGADCIVSAAASLPEVYGDSVRYIDPSDYDHIDLDAILAKPVSGTKQKVLDRYSWMKSAEIVLGTIERQCFV
ncbi:glycosyltransferase family 1 protein [Paratractidigestivibacter sp.]|uniref:glycosyltransferase family 4 protein n=1 Tax=Paratractidigestivibacter sp. TaxID=2847316 RepID=UPI002AC8C44C|nr:glycosyltransferase family 1 protein [Paratractidigestivibacter sp.]